MIFWLLACHRIPAPQVLQTDVAYLREASTAHTDPERTLQNILLQYPDRPDIRAEVLNRLGMLYMDRAYAARAENRLDEATINFQKAYAAWAQCLAEKPDFLGADRVFFDMATVQHELGNEDQEITMLQQMLQRWPDSHLIADIYLRLGEAAFAKGDMPQAIAAYSQALTEGGERYPYTCYKLAWCYYNMGEREQAIQTMQDLLSIAEKYPLIQSTLLAEARKDLLFFQQSQAPTPTSPPNVPGSTVLPGP